MCTNVNDADPKRREPGVRLLATALPPTGRIPFNDGKGHMDRLAQVLLRFAAGVRMDGKTAEETHVADLARSFEQHGLVELRESPSTADRQWLAECAFLLALMGLLETPRALLNALRYVLGHAVTLSAARLTDARRGGRDSLVGTGRRAHVVFVESADKPWPTEGVRLFEGASTTDHAAPTPSDKYAVAGGRIVGSPVLAIVGGERSWTVTFDGVLLGSLTADISIAGAWVGAECIAPSATTCVVKLSSQMGAPSAVTDLDGLTTSTPLLRLTSASGELVPVVQQIEVSVVGAVNVRCATDEGTSLVGGGMPFGETAEAGSGINLISPEWWQLGPKLATVVITPTWAGLPEQSFKTWYGKDPKQSDPKWFKVDKDLNVDLSHGAPLDESGAQWAALPSGSLAKRVLKPSDVSTLITPDPGYAAAPSSNDAFGVKPFIVYRDKDSNGLSKDPLPLFGGTDGEKPQQQRLTVVLPPGVLPTVPSHKSPPDDDDPAAWPWRIRLELQRSFMREQYEAHLRTSEKTVFFDTAQTITIQVPALETVKSGNMDVQVPKLVPSSQKIYGKELLLPVMETKQEIIHTFVPVTVPKAQWNPPYVPQWSSLRVDYTATDAGMTQQVVTPFG